MFTSRRMDLMKDDQGSDKVSQQFTAEVCAEEEPERRASGNDPKPEKGARGGGETMEFERMCLYNLARRLADDQIVYFGSTKSAYRERIAACSRAVSCIIPKVQRDVNIIAGHVTDFDFSPSVPGNGFRSILTILDKCILHIVHLLWRISKERASVMFKARYHRRELESFTKVLETMSIGLAHTIAFIQIATAPELFPEHSDEILRGLMRTIETLDQECFYGRVVGFQYHPSLRTPLQVIGIALSSFSDGFESRPSDPGLLRNALALVSSRKYALSPEKRAQRIVQVTRESSIHFCKAFWGLTESDFVASLALRGSPMLAINQIIRIPCDTSYYLQSRRAQNRRQSEADAFSPSKVEIGPPTDEKTAVVTVRLLSSSQRAGMTTRAINGCRPDEGKAPSPYLVFHIHGGGFVAQSSKSHEIYLRLWAKSLDVPIVSVDYSLAPEHPYPYAQKEVLFAYAWALNNPQRLGWTGEHVVFIGDSAGANLLTCVTVRLIDKGVARLPDALIPLYGAFLVRYIPSPSRFLSLMDPLLPIGILARCMAAYTGHTDTLDKPNWPLASTVLRMQNQVQGKSKPEEDTSSAVRKFKVRRTESVPSSPRPSPHGGCNGGKKDSVSGHPKLSHSSSVTPENLSPSSAYRPSGKQLAAFINCSGGGGTSTATSLSTVGSVTGNDDAPVVEDDPIVAASDGRQQKDAGEKPVTFSLDLTGDSDQPNSVLTPEDAYKDAMDDIEITIEEESDSVVPELELPEPEPTLLADDLISSDPLGPPLSPFQHNPLMRAPVIPENRFSSASLMSEADSVDTSVEHDCLAEVASIMVLPDPNHLCLSTEAFGDDFKLFLEETLVSRDRTSARNGVTSADPSASTAPPLKRPATVASLRHSRLRQSLSYSYGGSTETMTDNESMITSVAGYLVDGLTGLWDKSPSPEVLFPAYPLNPGANISGGVNDQSSDSGRLASERAKYDQPGAGRDITGQTGEPGPSSSSSEHCQEEKHPLSKFRNMNIPKDPFMSPMYASKDLLKLVPPVYIVGCHLDPLLDDSVMFARRLESAGVNVSLRLLDGLPHGFLNFVNVSKECRDASELCQELIRKAFGI